MRIWTSLAACLLALLFSGCADRPQISALAPSSVIVAFGDSLTFGTGASTDESYPACLARMLRCTVINRGNPGEETSGGRKRLRTVLQNDEPDLVVLCHGGNDMLRRKIADATRANLDAMITMAQEAGADVVLIGVPTPGLLLRVPDIFEDLAQQHGIPLEKDVLHEVLSDRSLKSDRIHPNADGYRRIAEAVAELVTSSTVEKHRE